MAVGSRETPPDAASSSAASHYSTLAQGEFGVTWRRIESTKRRNFSKCLMYCIYPRALPVASFITLATILIYRKGETHKKRTWGIGK